MLHEELGKIAALNQRPSAMTPSGERKFSKASKGVAAHRTTSPRILWKGPNRCADETR